MFTKKLSKLLINYKTWSSLQRLDSSLTCASRQHDINYFQWSCKYLCTSSIGHENLVASRADENTELAIFSTARKILIDSEIYSNNLASSLKLKDDIEIDNIDQFLMKPWISMSNTELLENFELLSNYAKKNEKNLMSLEFDGVLEIIQNRCSDFNDDELYHLLQCLELWIIDRHDQKFSKFWKYIDDECFNRFRDWSIDKILLFNDQYYKLKLTRVSEFTYHSLKKIGHKPEKYSLANLIHFAFLSNVNRKIRINWYNHEYCIEKQIDKLSLEELGIFASSITRFKSSIRSPYFLKKLVQKLKKDIDVVSNFTLTKNLQIFRVINDKELENEYISLLELLETQTSTRYLPVLSCIVEFQYKIALHNPNLLEKILDRFEKEIKNATIKDFHKIATALNKFSYDTKNCKFYSAMINELLSPDRAEEINKYSNLFINIVLRSLQANFYSEEALRIILDPQFIERASEGDKYNLNKDILLIDFCIELDHPEYNGPRLEKDLLIFLIQRFGSLHMEKIKKYQKIYSTHKLLEDVIHICKQVFNSESAILVDALFPQLPKMMIVICKDPNGNIIPPNKLSQIPSGTIKYAPKDGNKWYAILPASYGYLNKRNLKPSNTITMELRHLERIGYIPIMISQIEWKNLLDEEEKQTYIQEMLSR